MRSLTITVCPHCGARHDAATALEGEHRPMVGDCSLCFDCGGVGVFTKEGSGLRLPTAEESASMAADPEFVCARRSLLAWIAMRGR